MQIMRHAVGFTTEEMYNTDFSNYHYCVWIIFSDPNFPLSSLLVKHSCPGASKFIAAKLWVSNSNW